MGKKALGIEGFRNEYGMGVWIIYSDGSRRPLPHIVRHSPTGLEWGYGGSGPSDLALSILTFALGHRNKDVERLYDDFKRFHVAQFPRQKFYMPLDRIREWCEEQRRRWQT